MHTPSNACGARRSAQRNRTRLPREETPSPRASPASGSTSIHRAAKKGNADVVRALIEDKGVSANSVDFYGNTALLMAAADGHHDVVRVLLEQEDVALDAAEEVYGRTALHLCASRGHATVVQALLAHGADATRVNKRGETALIKAAQHGHYPCLELLLAAKHCQVDHRDSRFGYTALHRASLVGHIECVKILIVHGANLDAGDMSGSTPLHLCCARQHRGVARLLLENQVDVTKVDRQGRTAAHVAKEVGCLELEAMIRQFKRKWTLTQLSNIDVNTWSIEQVQCWLRALGISRAVRDAFASHDVSGAVLLQVTDDVMRDDFGISSWGQRRIVAQELERLSHGGTGAAEGATRSIAYEELEWAELLGVGNFGEVKRANWRGTDVAVKVLYRNYFKSDNEFRLFKKEVGIISRLHHPHILQFIGTFTTKEGNYGIVTEFMGGGSLRSLIASDFHVFQRRSGLLHRIVKDVCKAMIHLHNWKPPIIHRDLTSMNLLLDHNMTCKVADFGLSRMRDDEHTMTGGVGCLPWVAPEVVRGEPYNESADVFSFAMVMYELQSGQRPHAGHAHAVAFSRRVAFEGFRPPLPATTKYHWRHLITQAWDNAPEERPSFESILSRVEGFPPESAPGSSDGSSTDAAAAAAGPWPGTDASLASMVQADGYLPDGEMLVEPETFNYNTGQNDE